MTSLPYVMVTEVERADVDTSNIKWPLDLTRNCPIQFFFFFFFLFFRERIEQIQLQGEKE